MSKRLKVKGLILVSESVEEADKIINENYNFATVKEKIAFLEGMFTIESICDDKRDENTYWEMLNAIVFS